MEKKSYNVSTSENEGIVEIVFTGEVIRDSIQKVVDDVNAIIKPMNAKRLLWDIRALKMPRNYAEAYERVRKYPPHLCVKTAFVDLVEHSDFESFHEITSRNAGIIMKWFAEIDEARNWLKIK